MQYKHENSIDRLDLTCLMRSNYTCHYADLHANLFAVYWVTSMLVAFAHSFVKFRIDMEIFKLPRQEDESQEKNQPQRWTTFILHDPFPTFHILNFDSVPENLRFKGL